VNDPLTTKGSGARMPGGAVLPPGSERLLRVSAAVLLLAK
jgi:hypothetical protein